MHETMELKQLNAKLDSAATNQDRVSLLDSYAESLFEKGRYSEAGKYYGRALAPARQSNVRAYFAGQVGICHYNAGRDKEALRQLLKSARLFDPDKPEFMPDMCGFVHFYLGSLYEYHGKVAKSLEARQICERYAETQEKDTKWMLYAGISRNFEMLGRHDEAIRYSQKAIQVLSDNDPGLAYLYESMGNNYMGLKQYHEAIKYFSKVLELDPNFERSDEIHLKVASCYQQLTNDQMATRLGYHDARAVSRTNGQIYTAWGLNSSSMDEKVARTRAALIYQRRELIVWDEAGEARVQDENGRWVRLE